MAITKTIFTGATVADQASEILAWLQANAADYFDSITYDSENSTIICSEGGLAALVLGFASAQSSITIYSANGTYARTYNSNQKFDYGVVTSSGIYLVMADTRANHVVVTKNNNGQLFMAAKITPGSSTNTSHLYICDFYNSPTTGTTGNNLPYIFSTSFSGFEAAVAYSSELTSLTPIVALDYPSYTPNVFLEFFNEYSGVAGKVIIGDTEYFSNGYIAMKG